MLGRFTPLTDYRDVQMAPVLSVTWGGRTWRLSTRQLVGPDAEADPGLIEAPSVAAEISLEPGGDLGVSVSVAFVLPAVRIADYVDSSYDLANIELELAWVWHRNGRILHPWSAREVRASGWATEPEWGDPQQPAGYISCTLEDSPYRVQRPLVPRSYVVGADTWPSGEEGARGPLVLGWPDPNKAGGGPPAIVISTGSNLAISIGWCQAETVYIIDASGNSDQFAIQYQTDSLGQGWATINLLTSTVIDRSSSSYTSAWPDGPAMTPFGGYGPLHLSAYLLSIGGADIDVPEWVRHAGLLDLPMGGYVDDPDTEPWEVVRDLLSGLPVTMRRSRDGWAPVLLDPHVAPIVSTEIWRNDGPWRRTSAWSQTGDSRLTSARVEYEPDHAITAGDGSDPDAPLPHAWARHLPGQGDASQALSWVWDSSSAYRVLDWMARIRALGWEAASYKVPPQWGRAREGDWIYLADERRYAIVQRRSLDGGVWDYTLARPVAR